LQNTGTHPAIQNTPQKPPIPLGLPVPASQGAGITKRGYIVRFFFVTAINPDAKQPRNRAPHPAGTGLNRIQ